MDISPLRGYYAAHTPTLMGERGGSAVPGPPGRPWLPERRILPAVRDTLRQRPAAG